MSTNLSYEKKPYRTIPEQLTGLFILLLLTLTIFVFAYNISSYTELTCKPLFRWFGFSDCHRIFSSVVSLNSFSFWLIWRKTSLRTLKLEAIFLSVLYSLFLLWKIAFLILQNSLLSLTLLLFLGMLNVMLMALYWKKEKLSVYLLIPSLIWITYISWNNLSLCIN